MALHTAQGQKERVKRFLGRWVYRRQTLRWENYVQSHPDLLQASQTHPKLLSKIYRPYLIKQLNCKERVDALINHYETLQDHGLASITTAGNQAGLLLHEGLSKSGHSYRIVLTAVREGHREGELCLHLFFQEACVYALNFSLDSHYSANETHLHTRLIVGRLQGMASAQAKELVRLATREFYVCRPANVLIHVVRNIASVLGCTELLLVSNRQRVTLNPWRRYKLQANYNQVWLEAGAVKKDQDFFHIEALGATNTDYAQIASKKRSEAKKKNALLDAIHESVQQRFAEYKNGSRQSH